MSAAAEFQFLCITNCCYWPHMLKGHGVHVGRQTCRVFADFACILGSNQRGRGGRLAFDDIGTGARRVRLRATSSIAGLARSAIDAFQSAIGMQASLPGSSSASVVFRFSPIRRRLLAVTQIKAKFTWVQFVVFWWSNTHADRQSSVSDSLMSNVD